MPPITDGHLWCAASLRQRVKHPRHDAVLFRQLGYARIRQHHPLDDVGLELPAEAPPPSATVFQLWQLALQPIDELIQLAKLGHQHHHREIRRPQPQTRPTRIHHALERLAH